MKIADVMTPDLDTVSPGDTLSTAARLMADLDSGALPVGEDNRLVGTITGHDIAMQVAAEGLDPGKTTVGQAMSADVLYCFESESVEEVLVRRDPPVVTGRVLSRFEQERQRRASSQSRSSTGSRCSPGCEARASQIK